MSLVTYEDFMSLGNNSLKDYLSVRGLSVSGKKAELVARAFVAHEMKVEIILSSEEQLAKLKKEYSVMLKDNDISDPLLVPVETRINDITKWYAINSGNIFEYILKLKDFDFEYIGKYKDMKAYSYFDGGLVGEIKVFCQLDLQYIYCTVRSSMTVHNENDLWIVIKPSGEIVCAWCSCMAGSSHCCNHIIATLYKMEYATLHNLRDPACTSVACGWNTSTKKDVCPKRIVDINIRKKQRSSTKDIKTTDNNREQIRMQELNQFDPRASEHRTITSTELSTFLMMIQEKAPSAVVLKSIEGCGIPKNNHLSIHDIAEKCIAEGQSFESDSDRVSNFVSKLHLTKTDISYIEKQTRGQSDQPLWKKLREGRLTASKHHDIYTKINSILRRSKSIVKYSPLVAEMINPQSDISKLPAVQWGIENEDNALKAFYANEVSKHDGFKLEKCGLFIDKTRPYIGASPDAILKCKCHGISPVEIKCPYKIRDMTVKDGAKHSDFLKISSEENVILKPTHKYATQINSQMSLTGANQGFFVVWTEQDLLIQVIKFRKELWDDVSTNLEIFFKQFIAKALLHIKPIMFCNKCEKVLLEDNEVDKKENGLKRISCYSCSRYFHRKCNELFNENQVESDWLCLDCISSGTN